MIYKFSSIAEIPQNIINEWEEMEISIEQKPKWLEACETLLVGSTPVYFIEIKNRKIRGILIGNLVEKLDCTSFVLEIEIKKKIELIRKIEPDYFYFDVLFIGVPMSNNTGIITADISTSELVLRLKEFLIDNMPIDALFITNLLSKINLNKALLLNYPPTTKLVLDFENFDSYLMSLKKKKRWDLKNKRKIFIENNFRIDIISNSSLQKDEYKSIYKLYGNTEKKNASYENYTMYNPQDMFYSYMKMEDNYKWLLVKKDNIIVGFALIVEDQETLIFKHVGLDYEKTENSFTYFNLYYEAIKYALKNKFSFMNCGTTTYDAKKHLGCSIVERFAILLPINETAQDENLLAIRF